VSLEWVVYPYLGVSEIVAGAGANFSPLLSVGSLETVYK
jgi:hypothetical protein